MPLEQIQPTTENPAKTVARQIVAQITATAKRIAELREKGVVYVDAQPERKLPSGQIIPPRPAQAAVSADDINKELGEKNIAVLDALQKALE